MRDLFTEFVRIWTTWNILLEDETFTDSLCEVIGFLLNHWLRHSIAAKSHDIDYRRLSIRKSVTAFKKGAVSERFDRVHSLCTRNAVAVAQPRFVILFHG